jgi:hypothetical protein
LVLAALAGSVRSGKLGEHGKMRKLGDRARRAAAVLAATIGVYTIVAACGPQAVPIPTTRGFFQDGGSPAAPPPPAGGHTTLPPPAAGSSSQPAAASGSVAGPAPAAIGGSVAPPPPAGIGAPPITAGTTGPGDLPPYNAGTDPNRNRVLAGQLCARLATIECAGEVHCCNAPGRSVSACEADVAKGCNEGIFLDQIAQNRVTGFDPNATYTVFTELERRSAACDLSIPEWSVSADGLRGILKGTISPGASCKPTGALTDKPSQAAALASCTGVSTTACLPKSLLGDWTCVGKNATGGRCTTDDNCQAGLYCNNPQMMLLGTCNNRQAVGAACVNGTECQSFYCKGGRCVNGDTQVAFCLKQ